VTGARDKVRGTERGSSEKDLVRRLQEIVFYINLQNIVSSTAHHVRSSNSHFNTAPHFLL
jgi:hypothetical protein